MFKRLSIYRSLLLAGFFLLSFAGQTQNIAGGEIIYKFLYKTGGENPIMFYELTVKLYKECQDPSTLPSEVLLKSRRVNPPPIVPVYDPGLGPIVIPMSGFHVTKQEMNSCSPSQQPICYYIGEYKITLGLRPESRDYLFYVQSDQRKSANFV